MTKKEFKTEIRQATASASGDTATRVMKRVIVMIILAVFTAGAAMAQNDSVPADGKKKGGFGSFVKRIGEQTTGINMSDETFAVLPARAKQLIGVEVVSCIGDSKSGDVLLILAVKAKQNNVKTNLGKSCGNGNQKCITGYDTKGKTFEGKAVGSFSEVFADKENPVGIPVQYEFNFSSVPSTLKAIEVVHVEFAISGAANVHSGMSDIEPIQVRNIPIQWDVEAE